MKKFFALVLAILMLVSTLVSCDQGFMTEPYDGGAQNDDGDGDEGGYTAEIPTTQNPTDDYYGGEAVTEHVCYDSSRDGNHNCDYCGMSYVSICNDADNDHDCDDCWKTISVCYDSSNDNNHNCDICGSRLYGESCVDEDKDHLCDLCYSWMNCFDSNSDKDHNCDTCGSRVYGGESCVDENNDHYCDFCGSWMTSCSDSNSDKDHKCDTCGKEGMNSCYDSSDDTDHKCDVCGKEGITSCYDSSNDNNHNCDTCGSEMNWENCSDSSDDDDHKCDVCGEVLSECYDSEDDDDHNCDVCGEVLFDECVDHDSDGDHKCEYCTKIVSECVDSDSDHYCDDCGAYPTHSYQNGICVVCGEELKQYVRVDNKITFGSYPQTKVTDSALTATLNNLAGTLPTGNDSQAWTSYGYYVSGSVGNFMWYIDVEEGGEKYRGVYFTSYRPKDPTSSFSADYGYQGNNGYATSTVYWFKYEPISWTVLSENTTDGTALIFCDMIIDSQQYDYEDGSYSNNYAESTIRKWLNENFYNTAFNDLQKQIILTTTVDNSAATTSLSTNQYACENTEDKIFLLSYQDIINSNYGFSSNYLNSDTARQKKTTDYAQAQGAYTKTSSSYAGNGCWCLRSPYDDSSYIACGVDNGGEICFDYVYYTRYGVVPALQIKL